MVKLFWWKVGFFGLVALFQFSFLNNLFPMSAVPGILLSVIAALVLVRGFRTSLIEWLPLLIVYDIVRVGQLTTMVVVGIGLAYCVSFVSRRFVFEHSGIGLLFLGLFVASVSIGGVELTHLLSGEGLLNWTTAMKDFAIVVLCYPPIFLLVQWFEERAEAVHRAEFRGLRHA